MNKRSNNNTFKLRKNVDALSNKGKIPIGVDNYKQDGDILSRNFTIGYEYYNQSLCDVTLLNKSPLRKIIENHKKFGKCSTINELKSTGIVLAPVANTNHYSKFFKDLDPDTELKEFDSGSSERAFLFIDNYRNILQMVAYTNAHTESDKQKR